jgi:uncharacterized Zn finger protein
MDELVFMVAGSSGNPYSVKFKREGRRLIAQCTCEAGRRQIYCKHRFSLMGGVRDGVLSENVADVRRLNEMMRGTDAEAAYQAVLLAEDVYEKAKIGLSAAKKTLAAAMRG